MYCTNVRHSGTPRRATPNTRAHVHAPARFHARVQHGNGSRTSAVGGKDEINLGLLVGRVLVLFVVVVFATTTRFMGPSNGRRLNGHCSARPSARPLRDARRDWDCRNAECRAITKQRRGPSTRGGRRAEIRGELAASSTRCGAATPRQPPASRQPAQPRLRPGALHAVCVVGGSAVPGSQAAQGRRGGGCSSGATTRK